MSATLRTDELELLSIATQLAKAGAELAARMRAEGVDLAGTKSSRTDVVTAADKAVESMIRERLARVRPDDAFFGEESDASTGSSGLTWVVDPIDGTVNYLYGLPSYGISVAVVEGGADPATWSPVAGVVVNPAGNEFFAAARGQGATWQSLDGLESRELRLPEAPPLAEALVSTGFGYNAQRRTEQAEVAARLIGNVRDLRRMGVASIDLCYVAMGRLDAHYETGLNPWDHAAGALVAREAGAVVSGLAGEAEGRAFLMACHPDLQPEFEDALVAAGAAPWRP